MKRESCVIPIMCLKSARKDVSITIFFKKNNQFGYFKNLSFITELPVWELTIKFDRLTFSENLILLNESNAQPRTFSSIDRSDRNA